MPQTQRADIRDAIISRYPCMIIPHGEMDSLRLEFGVTRQRISQLAHKLGVHGTRHKSYEPVRLCPVCNKPLSPQNTGGYHRECAYVMLPCVNCSKPVRRSAKRLALLNGHKNTGPDGKPIAYTGRVFCNRQCFGSWAGRNHGWGAGSRRKKPIAPPPTA